MRLLAHISDLHFGTENPAVAAALIADLRAVDPSLLIVSGDLTQRARQSQFLDARHYLAHLPSPQLVVPGNHDVPLYDVFRRFFAPLKRYCRFITSDLSPFYRDQDLAVLGINTARSLTWKNGRISFEQLERIRSVFQPIHPPGFKVLVTHHPFIPPRRMGEPGVQLVGRAAHALEVIDQCKVDLLLAGHLHHGYTGDVRTFYPARKRSIIAVQAGTAISKRLRGDPNAYNVIALEPERIQIMVRTWQSKGFAESLRLDYMLQEGNWVLNPARK